MPRKAKNYDELGSAYDFMFGKVWSCTQKYKNHSWKLKISGNTAICVLMQFVWTQDDQMSPI